MAILSLSRSAILAAGLSLGLAALLILRSVAPATDPRVTAGVALMALACFAALAVRLDASGVKALAPLSLVAAIATCAAAALLRDARSIAWTFGFASLGVMIVGAYALLGAARWRSILSSRGNWLLFAAVAGLIALYCFYYVTVSRDLMFGDFMYRRVEAIVAASFLDKGQFAQLLALFVGSMKDEYSLLPILAPGAVLAVSDPSSRAWYQGAEIVFYAAPAYLALGVLARDLARRAGLRSGAALAPIVLLALATVGALAAYPTGIAVVARGMPDVGGVVLVVASVRLADRLARLLALPPGREATIGRLSRRTAFALALCLFAMFLFRRWYAFAAVGVLAMLALEIAMLAVRGRRLRWREAVASAAIGALALLALSAPVLIDWLPNAAAHDYVSIYAAYRKEPALVIAELFDWFGAAVLAGAALCAILLAVRSRDGRLLRLTCGSSVIAAALFLRVQSPAIHHAYLLASAIAAPIGAVILILFQRSNAAAFCALAGLAAFTLTPAVSAWAPRGIAPSAGQPPSPREDLAELARLKAWIDAHARPDHRYCVLASSYTINDALVDELWQLDAGGLPSFGGKAKTSVGMAHVDTRDGAPVDGLEDCAIMLVGDPVQTHLVPAYQQTIIVPAREMLNGDGIGADYRRSGEVFNLEKGVKLVAFDRIRPLADADIAGLRARWRTARDRDAVGLRGTRAD